MSKRKDARPVDPAEASFAKVRHAKKRAFLAAFAKTGVILHAAAAAGCDRHMHAYWLRRDATYREAFRIAQEESIERMELEARRRAVNGVDEPVFQGGKQVGLIRRYSDTLLIFQLKAARPSVYRENVRHEVGGADGGPIKIESIQQHAAALAADPEAAALIEQLARKMTFNHAPSNHDEGTASLG